MAEMIDIYDENRVKTGLQKPRSQRLMKGQYMLYVLALLRESGGRYLITRRSLDKKWAAGSWEIPGGGSVAGETSEQAVCREVAEETGLNITACPKRVIYTYSNEDLPRGDNYHVDIYLVDVDFTLADVRIQPEEVIGVDLADLAGITRLYEADGFLHYERIRQALEG